MQLTSSSSPSTSLLCYIFSISPLDSRSMDSAGNTVSYCCIWKADRLLYTYNNGGRDDIHNLAASCLEKTPRYHRWYFETAGTYTFAFLIDADGHVYFTIVRHSLGNSRLLRFLQTLRDEFRRAAAGGQLQEQLFPVVLGLVASLEQWPPAAPANNTVDDAPLLGNKKTSDDQVVMMIEMEENERSGRGRLSSDQGASSSSSENASTRMLSKSSSSRNSQKNKWCRRVRIVLAVDAAVCFLLFMIWLFICHGTQCIR